MALCFLIDFKIVLSDDVCTKFQSDARDCVARFYCESLPRISTERGTPGIRSASTVCSHCRPDRLVNHAPELRISFPRVTNPIAIPSWTMLIVDKMTLILVGVRSVVYLQTHFVLIV